MWGNGLVQQCWGNVHHSFMSWVLCWLNHFQARRDQAWAAHTGWLSQQCPARWKCAPSFGRVKLTQEKPGLAGSGKTQCTSAGLWQDVGWGVAWRAGSFYWAGIWGQGLQGTPGLCLTQQIKDMLYHSDRLVWDKLIFSPFRTGQPDIQTAFWERSLTIPWAVCGSPFGELEHTKAWQRML